MKGLARLPLAKDCQFPDFYNFCEFRTKIYEDEERNKQKLVDMIQHVYEWSLPTDFSQADFSALMKILKCVVSDFRTSGEPKRLDHPVKTSLGDKTYYGYFSGSKGFENTHIIDIQSTQK